MGFENVIAVEDDMEISPDFFSFFENTFPLLAKDPTLWTISAFNDNGQPRFVSENKQLWRSDFFPGLGKFQD
jgi:alpha-1,3-mannosyl-glycoprotein beta-1,2-N-acetylglucosaminyltransferase